MTSDARIVCVAIL